MICSHRIRRSTFSRRACLHALSKVYAADVGQDTVAVGPDLHPCEGAEHNAGKVEKFSYQMFK